MYDRKDKSVVDEIGIIAEELCEVRPDFIIKDKNGQIETISSRPLIFAVINEVQKHEISINELKAENIELKAEIEKLKSKK